MSSDAPAETSTASLGMVAAFWWEVRPMLRRQREVKRLGQNLYRLTVQNEPVVLAISGAGAENASRVARELAQRFPLRGMISVGFAAGLRESLQPGELIVADTVVDEKSGERFSCAESLLPIASGQRGGLLSVSEVIGSAEQKRRLGKTWGALAADMESAGVARAARAAGLAFGAVKSITDSSDESIAIDFQRCRSEHGGLSSWKVVREGLASPQALRDLWRLAGNSRRAAGSLALALGSV
ncbi:MAG TPA: hypothetical protein VIC04_09380 [Terriglobia bacterium]